MKHFKKSIIGATLVVGIGGGALLTNSNPVEPVVESVVGIAEPFKLPDNLIELCSGVKLNVSALNRKDNPLDLTGISFLVVIQSDGMLIPCSVVPRVQQPTDFVSER